MEPLLMHTAADSMAKHLQLLTQLGATFLQAAQTFLQANFQTAFLQGPVTFMPIMRHTPLNTHSAWCSSSY
jgi:hypothetical protein